MVAAGLGERLQHPLADGERRVAPAHIDVVALQEGGRRQHDIGVAGGRRHELLVDAQEQVVPRQPGAHRAAVRRHLGGIGVLDQHRRDRRTTFQRAGRAGQHRADARLVERADRRIGKIEAVGEVQIQAPVLQPGIEGAAALLLPRAGEGRQAAHGVHGDGPVARPGEAEAEAQEAPPGPAVQPGEVDNVLFRQAGNLCRPGRRPAQDMALDVRAEVGQPGEIIPVRQPFGQDHLHHGERERAVGARAQDQRPVGRLHRRRVVDVDYHELGAALLAGAPDVAHQVDMGGDRIAAPHDDQVGFRRLGRVGAGQHADAGLPARGRRADANGRALFRIALGVAQPVEAPAADEAQGAAGMIGPDRLAAVAGLGAQKGLGDLVQGVVPGNRGEIALALGAGAAQRPAQPVRVVDALGVARDLLAHDAGRVGQFLVAPDPADARRRQALDFQGAGARAIVGAGGADGRDRAGGRRRCGSGGRMCAIERHELPFLSGPVQTSVGSAGRGVNKCEPPVVSRFERCARNYPTPSFRP